MWPLAISLLVAVVSSNVLVLLPFRSSPLRLRAPSEQLLRALAVVDLVRGSLLLLPAVVSASKCGLSGLAPVLTAFEAAAILLTLAVALDKAASLARPLHYNEIVTNTTLYVYLWLTLSASGFAAFLSVVRYEYEQHVCSPFMNGGTVLLALTAPVGVLIVVCYVYVYLIANRHARDIKKVRRTVRNKEMGDVRHMQTSMQVVNNNVSRSVSAASPLQPHSPQENYPHRLARKRRQQQRDNSLCGSYGCTLVTTTSAFFACRLPAYAQFAFAPQNVHVANVTVLLVFLACALDPWLYAYHNLNIKPLMRKILVNKASAVAAICCACCFKDNGQEDDSGPLPLRRRRLRRKSKCGGGGRVTQFPIDDDESNASVWAAAAATMANHLDRRTPTRQPTLELTNQVKIDTDCIFFFMQ